jgi:DNA-binding MarR family transcriptional regulator
MGALRTIMARPDISPFTVPQFRSLLYVHRHVGASLSETADFLGLTLPSASKLVDQLVKRGLLVRQHDPADRRRMTLRLTATGDALLKGAQATVRRQLATMLAAFSDAELAVLERALTLLHLSFPPPLGDPTHPFARPAAVADR